MRRITLVFALAIAWLVVGAFLPPLAQSSPAKHVHVSDYIDQVFLEPRHSVLTGDMFIHLRDVHHIPIVDAMVLLQMETTMGAPNVFTRHNNFGCVKYFQKRTVLFRNLVPGTFWYWGSRWYSWKTPAQGMCAWGRFIEHWGDGWFLRRLKAGDWTTVARVYNGGSTYAARCRALDVKYTAMFKAAGYPLTASGWTP